MANKYKQVTNDGSATHFGAALSGQIEMSRMTAVPEHLTTFNGGDIVPIYYSEVLPHDSISLSLEGVIRQSTLLTPTMGSAEVSYYAFFVPNRIVNHSWKAVMGENYSGSWVANKVTLAPLYNADADVQVPVGSVADYYGFPTQQKIPAALLAQCNDLKFRGYCMIYNERFRDQNYQPPIPMSYLNIYEGFFQNSGGIGLTSASNNLSYVPSTTKADGSFGAGAVVGAFVRGGTDGGQNVFSSSFSLPPRVGNASPSEFPVRFYALGSPLKANKLHDYFTSVLPSPQKGESVFVPILGDRLRVTTGSDWKSSGLGGIPLRGGYASGAASGTGIYQLFIDNSLSLTNGSVSIASAKTEAGTVGGFVPLNLGVDLSGGSLSLSVDDLRMSSTIQQVYEQLARSGSRYREYVRGFFGLEVDDPFSDIPCYLGHFTRSLDLYQTAQTSSSEEGGTPQGNLAAFGYTQLGGNLFHRTFVEHGYIHVFAVVRHKNIYPSYFAKDNLRMSFLDFYQPQMANISEQPVWTAEINPFKAIAPDGSKNVFGYQEAWAEYRFEPNRVSGYMRPGIAESLSLWNYADDFDSDLQISDGFWLRSNTQEVVDRTLAVRSSVAHQFKAQFTFFVDKERPMPTYSVPGVDII